jgi:hypothetical protein
MSHPLALPVVPDHIRISEDEEYNKQTLLDLHPSMWAVSDTWWCMDEVAYPFTEPLTIRYFAPDGRELTHVGTWANGPTWNQLNQVVNTMMRLDDINWVRHITGFTVEDDHSLTAVCDEGFSIF